MSERVGTGRPLGVTVVVVLTGALAVFDLLLGILTLLDAPEARSCSNRWPIFVRFSGSSTTKAMQ